MEKTIEKVWILVPVYNEGGVVGQVIINIHRAGYQNIVVVNDGSTDDTAMHIPKDTCVYVEHKLNRGKGAAIRTGIETALLHGADIFVTMDGDGQHDAGDLRAVVQPILAGHADVVLGTRSHGSPDMPFVRRLGNSLANGITWLLHGLRVQDSQSGFRAYSRVAVSHIQSTADDYAFESEIIREIHKAGLRYTEVPIKTIYTVHSRQKSHGQGLGTGLLTFIRIVWGKIT